MIVADPKTLTEIAGSVAAYARVHVGGCGACVTVCRAGGRAEAEDIARRLSSPAAHGGRVPPELTVGAIERQCERDLVKDHLAVPEGTEAVLSLACGCGVQVVADVLEPLPVIPALSTTFMGGSDEPGVWSEKCEGCGDCLLATTGGICPIARCAKSLLNGPCGGSHAGLCEVEGDLPCAWQLIHDRLKLQGRLDLIMACRPPRSWRRAGYGGLRSRRRTGVAGGPGDTGR